MPSLAAVAADVPTVKEHSDETFADYSAPEHSILIGCWGCFGRIEANHSKLALWAALVSGLAALTAECLDFCQKKDCSHRLEEVVIGLLMGCQVTKADRVQI